MYPTTLCYGAFQYLEGAAGKFTIIQGYPKTIGNLLFALQSICLPYLSGFGASEYLQLEIMLRLLQDDMVMDLWFFRIWLF